MVNVSLMVELMKWMNVATLAGSSVSDLLRKP